MLAEGGTRFLHESREAAHRGGRVERWPWMMVSRMMESEIKKKHEKISTEQPLSGECGQMKFVK